MFSTIGYAVDYIVNGKYKGSVTLEQPDRETFGYLGRKTETLTEDIQLSNKRKIKKGTLVTTELFPLNGRNRKIIFNRANGTQNREQNGNINRKTDFTRQGN